MERAFAEADQLGGLVRAAFGSDRRLDGVTRLRGGTKKGVYRLALDDGSTVALYSWADAENYWPATAGDPADPFGDASGLDLFEVAQARLTGLGVRTPALYLADRSRSHLPADVALVEDVPGENLERRLAADPAGAAGTLAELGAALAAMRDCHGPAFGKVALVEGGAVADDRPAEQVVLDRAMRDLADAAGRVERIAAVQDRLTEVALELRAAVLPRAEYSLLHGELGADHVLVDAAGHPVLIDIEGALYFDVEWEHAFLELRFREHYPALHATGLDERRLRFYRLAMYLSLVAGPLRLLDGDFPDRAFMLEIVEGNLERVLTFVR